MRSRLIFLGLLGLAFALSFGSASGSGGAKASVTEPVIAEAAFRLPGSHGYSIAVAAYEQDGAPNGTVEITVSRGREAAFYRTVASVTDEAVRIDLGRLGRIEVLRRPSGNKKTVHPKCLHGSETYETGFYEGLIEFNGEEGYTRAKASRAPILPAAALFASRGPCGSGYGEAVSANEPGARLRGISFAGGRTLSFQANKNSRKAKTFYTASLKERSAGVLITRELSGVASASAFRFARSLKTATLSLPRPFSGSASLARSKNSISPIWTGDLALDFPGRLAVTLAGPRVHVSIAHARFNRSNNSSIGIGF